MLSLNTRDEASLSPEFFSVLETGDDYLLLFSKLAFHKWKLVYSDYSILIYHAHHIEDQLHYQTGCLDVYNAMLYILDHEDYQLNHRRKKRLFVSKPLEFSMELMEMYGLQ